MQWIRNGTELGCRFGDVMVTDYYIKYFLTITSISELLNKHSFVRFFFQKIVWWNCECHDKIIFILLISMIYTLYLARTLWGICV